MNNQSRLWKNKSLIWTLAVIDLKIKYRNSVLGFFWTFLEPLLLLAVLYLVFTNIFKSDIEYFPLYLLLGIIIWNVIVRTTSFSLTSIIDRKGILTQINFPREIFVISSSITVLLMFIFEFMAFGIFLGIFQFLPPVSALLLPYILLLLFIFVLGLSFALSSLNVYFRDVQFIWTVILHAGFFLVPIFYSLEILPQEIRRIIVLNPMAQIIEMAHNTVLYNVLPSLEDLTYTTVIVVVTFFVGYFIFKRLEGKMVEEL